MLGNTLVIPPSVDANTDRKPYLQEFTLSYSLCSWNQVVCPLQLTRTLCANVLLIKLIPTHEVKSLFFQTRDASSPMMRESKNRLWMRLWSPAAQSNQSHIVLCVSVRRSNTYCRVTHIHQSLGRFPAWARGSSVGTGCCCRRDAGACSTLWGDGGQNWKQEDKVRWMDETVAAAVTSEPRTHGPKTQRCWAAATACLQHTQGRDRCPFILDLHSHQTESRRAAALDTHTAAAASRHSGQPGWRTRCTEAGPDRDWMEGGQSQKGGGSISTCQAGWCHCLTVSPVVCAIDRSPGVTPLHLIHVLLWQKKMSGYNCIHCTTFTCGQHTHWLRLNWLRQILFSLRYVQRKYRTKIYWTDLAIVLIV